MKLKTPEFWYRPPDSAAPLREIFLRPFSWLYMLGRALHRLWATEKKAPVPVICIGNLNAGGAGKTPAALAIFDIFRTYNLALNPFFLSRGYGAALKGPIRVNPALHRFGDVGDEALLLAEKGPAVIARNRLYGAHLAAQEGADILIMDDGLQNPYIKKDIRCMVIDGAMGFGNRKTLPAGPLRESLQAGLENADAFIFIGKDRTGALDILPKDKPVFSAMPESAAPAGPPPGNSYIAFSGLGYPQKFFDFLRSHLKLNVIETAAFPDHHPYSDKDLDALRQKAGRCGAELITTEKDALRLPDAAGIHVTAVRLVWEDENALKDFLAQKLRIYTERSGA